MTRIALALLMIVALVGGALVHAVPTESIDDTIVATLDDASTPAALPVVAAERTPRAVLVDTIAPPPPPTVTLVLEIAPKTSPPQRIA